MSFGMKKRGSLYSSSEGSINGRPFNDGWQRIINLNLILAFGKIWCIKCEDW